MEKDKSLSQVFSNLEKTPVLKRSIIGLTINPGSSISISQISPRSRVKKMSIHHSVKFGLCNLLILISQPPHSGPQVSTRVPQSTYSLILILSRPSLSTTVKFGPHLISQPTHSGSQVSTSGDPRSHSRVPQSTLSYSSSPHPQPLTQGGLTFVALLQIHHLHSPIRHLQFPTH